MAEVAVCRNDCSLVAEGSRIVNLKKVGVCQTGSL
jgi:hypothetical protein